MPFYRRISALATLVCVFALTLAAAVDARPAAQHATFNVTLSATLTKTWDYVTNAAVGECTVSTRVQGSRTVTLRSRRPTRTRVTSSGRGPSFSPAAVRLVTARASQSGATTRTERGLGCSGRIHTVCAPSRRTLSNQTVRYYRSRAREISFRRTRDFGGGLPLSCPPQAPEVRVEQPGLHQAEGEVSERDLFNRGVRSLTASGGSEETTEIEGDPDGRVVVRVSWNLRFTRVG
jgi:hypothetical protein